LDQSGCTLYFSWCLAPGVKFGGKICFAVLSKWPLQDFWMSPMELFLSFSKRTKTRTRLEKLLNKLLHVKSQIVFIHSFLIPYRSLARRLARSRYGIKNEWIKTIWLLTCNNLYLVYTTQVNSAFRALWLVNSEVISKYYSPPSNRRKRFSTFSTSFLT